MNNKSKAKKPGSTSLQTKPAELAEKRIYVNKDINESNTIHKDNWFKRFHIELNLVIGLFSLLISFTGFYIAYKLYEETQVQTKNATEAIRQTYEIFERQNKPFIEIRDISYKIIDGNMITMTVKIYNLGGYPVRIINKRTAIMFPKPHQYTFPKLMETLYRTPIKDFNAVITSSVPLNYTCDILDLTADDFVEIKKTNRFIWVNEFIYQNLSDNKLGKYKFCVEFTTGRLNGYQVKYSSYE